MIASVSDNKYEDLPKVPRPTEFVVGKATPARREVPLMTDADLDRLKNLEDPEDDIPLVDKPEMSESEWEEFVKASYNETDLSDLLSLHIDLCRDARKIMEAKNHDYRGGSGDPYANFRGAELLDVDPVIGILLRMQDKTMRIKTFVEKGELKVKGESLTDALIDLINYTVLIKGLTEDD